ncbi:hypothetical protein MBH78_18205 [Oceanimonas sp. NS1]|nr:hypothetical protein [Oceanimonas sp. NS1]
MTTGNFLQMEPGVRPDLFINKVSDPRDGYHSIPLFHDLIYPVCTPAYLQKQPGHCHPGRSARDRIAQSEPLRQGPGGGARGLECVVFLFQYQPGKALPGDKHLFNANDYNMLIQMVLNHQGVSLGWHHLVAPLVEEGLLVRPVEQEVIFGKSATS